MNKDVQLRRDSQLFCGIFKCLAIEKRGAPMKIAPLCQIQFSLLTTITLRISRIQKPQWLTDTAFVFLSKK